MKHVLALLLGAVLIVGSTGAAGADDKPPCHEASHAGRADRSWEKLNAMVAGTEAYTEQLKRLIEDRDRLSGCQERIKAWKAEREQRQSQEAAAQPRK